MESKYVFGVDLGTTYSCISYFDENGQTVVCPSIEGSSTTPSVVRLEEGCDPIVGESAKNSAVIYPDNTIQFVKARIGKDASFNYGPDLSLTTTPVAVSAEILKKLANDAGNYTNSLVKSVVITVPAYFGDPEKKATRQAGIDAGLDVLGIIEEPTAAAIYYGMTKAENEENVIVFDLGGGTFDVTAMNIKGNSFTVITTEGDHDLGGKNWDAALIELVKAKFEEETGWDDGYDNDIEQELVINIEKAKIMLTSAEKATIPVKIDKDHRASIQITREEFDDCTATLMERAILLTQKVVDRINCPISKILMVGGSTYMPQVKEAISVTFPDIEIYINEPNSAVSKGASIYAYTLLVGDTPKPEPKEETTSSGEATESTTEKVNRRRQIAGETYKEIGEINPDLQDVTITTVATKSLGLEVIVDDQPKIENVIMKDTVLPVLFEDTYYTAYDNTIRIPLNIYQANNFDEFYEIDEKLKIGTAMLTITNPLPKGAPIKVTISISEDGLIHVHGLDLTYNCEIEADIENDAVVQKQS